MNETLRQRTHSTPYAILSHTWSNTEATLQQYQTALASSKIHETFLQISPGYSKIDKSCQQARADGLPHVWIDACCVDKTSSAEVSELINSIYSLVSAGADLSPLPGGR